MKIFESEIRRPDIVFLEKYIRSDSILQELRAAREKGPTVIKEKYTTGRYEINLSEDAVSEILDELGNLFSTMGLEDDSEPNSLGIMIEDLIDLFGREYYENLP